MRAGWPAGLVAALTLTGCQAGTVGDAASSTGASYPNPPAVDRRSGPAPIAPPSGLPRPGTGPLLQAAPGGDGDSWRDTQGVEYRLGLVNAPELSECYGEAASRKRRQLTAAGFRATSYAVDSHGRRVTVVYLADGRNLNVWLARHGYADDRYLNRFRHENRSLAAQLDPAFAAAKRERLGLWGACGSRR